MGEVLVCRGRQSLPRRLEWRCGRAPPPSIDGQKHGMVDLAHTATAGDSPVVVVVQVVSVSLPAPRAQAQALNATWT